MDKLTVRNEFIYRPCHKLTCSMILSPVICPSFTSSVTLPSRNVSPNSSSSLCCASGLGERGDLLCKKHSFPVVICVYCLKDHLVNLVWSVSFFNVWFHEKYSDEERFFTDASWLDVGSTTALQFLQSCLSDQYLTN